MLNVLESPQKCILESEINHFYGLIPEYQITDGELNGGDNEVT